MLGRACIRTCRCRPDARAVEVMEVQRSLRPAMDSSLAPGLGCLDSRGHRTASSREPGRRAARRKAGTRHAGWESRGGGSSKAARSPSDPRPPIGRTVLERALGALIRAATSPVYPEAAVVELSYGYVQAHDSEAGRGRSTGCLVRGTILRMCKARLVERWDMLERLHAASTAWRTALPSTIGTMPAVPQPGIDQRQRIDPLINSGCGDT